MTRQITQTRTHKIRKDTNLSQLRAAQVKRIKKQREAFRDKVKRQQTRVDKLTGRQAGKLQQKLTTRQLRRQQKTIKKNISKRRKLRYNQTGGDIALGNIIDNMNWQINFSSTNVWKFKIRGSNLMVAFLDGSVYLYFGAAKLFLGMIRAGSKGKYVWNNLRRKGVSYIKIA